MTVEEMYKQIVEVLNNLEVRLTKEHNTSIEALEARIEALEMAERQRLGKEPHKESPFWHLLPTAGAD